MTINNIMDFAEYKGTKVENLRRDFYKYTDCGAWIEYGVRGITIGTITEGSDAEFSITLKFPFTSDEYEKRENLLEELAYDAWREANEE